VIQSARKELESVLEGLDEAQMTEVPVQGEWTIKDILVHIAAWERLAADRIKAARSGSALHYPVIQGDQDADAFNARVYTESRTKSLAEVQIEFETAHQALLNQVEALDDAILSEKLPFDWAGNLSYQVLISANTHWHYHEHRAAIEA
jgi:hypothetical protein